MFKIKTTVSYHGQPSYGEAKFSIHLEDGTVLVGTDDWISYPTPSLVLHSGYLHPRVRLAWDDLVVELRNDYDSLGIDPTHVAARLPQEIGIGDPHILVCLTYGRWRQPTRSVEFASKVVGLETV